MPCDVVSDSRLYVCIAVAPIMGTGESIDTMLNHGIDVRLDINLDVRMQILLIVGQGIRHSVRPLIGMTIRWILRSACGPYTVVKIDVKIDTNIDTTVNLDVRPTW